MITTYPGPQAQQPIIITYPGPQAQQPQVQPPPYQPPTIMTYPQPTVMTASPMTTTTATPGFCSCTCQCPYGAIQPQIQGATVNYQYLPPSQQQLGRRRRRLSDTSYDFNIHKE